MLNRLVVLGSIIAATGCGEFNDQWKCTVEGNSCDEVDHASGEERVDSRSQGPQGDTGPRGEKGEPGIGCSIAAASNGAIITCGTNSVLILNGLDGADGEDGEDAPPTAYTITELIDPCGDESGFDEILLRLASGILIAHYSHGNKQFLVSIGPGNYVTTDGHSCSFSVSNDLQVTW